jgi:signal transduction histidine kinase
VATYKEKTEALKKKIKKALFYPAAVLVVAVIVTIILLIFVIPQFESLFAGFGADLPAFTQMVINLSKFVQKFGIFMAGILVGGAGYAFLYFKKRSRKMRETLDRMMLKLPIIGPIMHKAAIARFARTLSTMFAAGVPLVEALESVAGATGNIVYENATLAMRDEVATGTAAAACDGKHRPVPQHGGADDRRRRRGRRARRDVGQGGHVLRGRGGQRRGLDVEPARAADHGHPGRARRRPGHRDVPAHLQARPGGLTR